MSELKAGVLVTPHNEGMCFHRSSAVIAATEGETEFYLKSEVDKVIADLEESHKMEVEQLLMEIVKLKDRVHNYVMLIQDYQQKLAETEELLRWRKVSEELPTDETEVLVILDNGWRTTDYFEKDKGRWHYHWNTVAYWFSTPKATEEANK